MPTTSTKLSDMPFFMQRKVGSSHDEISYTAAQFRNYTAALATRTGTLGSAQFLVTESANVGWTITVNSGYVRVGGSGANYLVRLGADLPDLPVDVNHDPPLIRTHAVYVAVYDGQVSATADDYEARLVITEDTGAGAPIPPGPPAAYLPIATITVKPNQPNIQNADIRNTARHGGAAGEYVPLEPYLNPNLYESAGSSGGTAVFRAIYMSAGVVRLGGSIKRKDGKPFDGGESIDIGTMHSNFRPDRIRYLTCPCAITEPHTDKSGTYTCRLTITPAGLMTIHMPVGQSPNQIFFDGVTYDLDQ